MLAAALFMPLVLAAPAVWLVKRHTTELRSAQELLRQEVHRLDDAIMEIADIDKLRSATVTRHAVWGALKAKRLLELRLLNALGTLPAGLQLTRATASGGVVVLVGITSDPPVVTAAVEALQARGLDEVEITQREPRNDTGPGEQFEIRARYDGLSKHHGAAPSGGQYLVAETKRMTPP